jgi:hypothetical protein
MDRVVLLAAMGEIAVEKLVIVLRPEIWTDPRADSFT